MSEAAAIKRPDDRPEQTVAAVVTPRLQAVQTGTIGEKVAIPGGELVKVMHGYLITGEGHPLAGQYTHAYDSGIVVIYADPQTRTQPKDVERVNPSGYN